MSIQATAPDPSPLEFDLTDRLTKSLKVSGLKVEELANRLGVSRATIANWTSGRTRPRKNDLRAWAAETAVPLQWLETGKLPPSGGNDGSHNVSFLPGSNRRPFHYKANTRALTDFYFGPVLVAA